MDLSELRQEHAQLLDQSITLRQLVGLPNRAEAVAQSCAALDVMAATLELHLNKEDRDYYPWFLLSKNETVRLTASRFFVEMGHLRRAFNGYREAWRIPSVIHGAYLQFVAETGCVLDLVEKRIRLEETDLYPLWESSGETPHPN